MVNENAESKGIVAIRRFQASLPRVLTDARNDAWKRRIATIPLDSAFSLTILRYYICGYLFSLWGHSMTKAEVGFAALQAPISGRFGDCRKNICVILS